jgi:UPF0755 protein
MAKKSQSSAKRNKILGIVLCLILIIGGIAVHQVYKAFFGPNVKQGESYLYVHTGWTYEQVLQEIEQKDIVHNLSSFRKVAEQMDYPSRVKAGRFKLQAGMSNRQLVNKLAGGLQDPVRVQFHNLRLREDLAGNIAKQLEADSLSLLETFNNDSLAQSLGFTKDNFFSLFIPNTYEFYWNTSAELFIARMKKEYDRFWNEERLTKAKTLGLTPQEVSILASIVLGEAIHNSEMPTIAGLYINRLKKGMRLQADPTVIYAVKDFTIRRVLYSHLNFDSPYNTYMYAGLPPGPINLPSIAAIDAVLNYRQHNFIYMCAKEDFSGYHRFAETAAEHSRNARLFQQALNQRNIKR